MSASQIKIAISLVSIVGPAGNQTFGVPTVSDQQSSYQDVIDAINAAGGVACRKLAAQYFQVNPTDSADEEQKCLDIVAAGVFVEIDAGGFYTPGTPDCFPQHNLPFLGSTILANQERDQFYPYLFGKVSMDLLYRNTVFALSARGFFSAGTGFRRLGFIYRDCSPPVITEFLGWLHQVGLSSGQISTYDVGCPSAFANPGLLEQAILKFKQDGVTNVTEAHDIGDFPNFTTIAEEQGFHPRYGVPDDNLVSTTYGAQHPNYANIANAVAITADRIGEERTPGMTPNAATARCSAIFEARGGRSVYLQPGGFGGAACDQLWEAATAIQHAPSLVRSALAAGLESARSVEFAYPTGPNDFAVGPRVTTGDQFWRTLQFLTACNCWRVIDRTFHPSFPGGPS